MHIKQILVELQWFMHLVHLIPSVVRQIGKRSCDQYSIGIRLFSSTFSTLGPELYTGFMVRDVIL